jgi:sulfite exporter TauE/SafE
MIWPEIAAVVLLGLGGSFGHCVGMCGGFALAIGRNAGGPGGLLMRHLAYQAGKALTYVFLAVLLTAGLDLLRRGGGFVITQMILSLLAGVIMLLYGLMQVAEWRPTGGWARVLEPFPGCRALATLANSAGPVPAFFTGWLNGFLPCGLVWAALLQLAATESVTIAVAGALAFGAATFPGLFLFGLMAHAWNPRWRRRLVRFTGVLLIAFGVITILRAFPGGRHWLHDTIIPAVWFKVKEWCGFPGAEN